MSYITIHNQTRRERGGRESGPRSGRRVFHQKTNNNFKKKEDECKKGKTNTKELSFYFKEPKEKKEFNI